MPLTWRSVVELAWAKKQTIRLLRDNISYGILTNRFNQEHIRVLHWAIGNPDAFCKQQKNDAGRYYSLYNDPIWLDKFGEY
jgi:hypothetical protein